MSLTQHLARQAFYAACILGRPFGGIRPNRIYRLLARAGFTRPDLRWVTTSFGFRMKLCPFYLIDREILAFGVYDRSLHAALERFVRPGMTCLDVGANIGDATLHMARLVGPSGRVHAFEPAPSPSARLREHVAANHFQDRVTIHVVALADKAGTASFSFASPAAENQGMGSLVSHDNEVVSKQTQVNLQTLDAFVEEHVLQSIGLVKVDIQGAEPLFLRGGAAAFGRFKPTLLLEIAPHELASIGSDSQQLLSIVESLGYSVHLLGMDGAPARRLASRDIAPDFEASNVVCLS